MGIVIREFLCRDCGNTFESSDNPEDIACPVCSAEEPERVFLTAPAIRSGDTSRKDQIVKELAADYGLSNVSNKEGKAVRETSASQFTPANPQVTQMLAKLGNNADNASGILPILKRSSNPTWGKAAPKVQVRK